MDENCELLIVQKSEELKLVLEKINNLYKRFIELNSKIPNRHRLLNARTTSIKLKEELKNYRMISLELDKHLTTFQDMYKSHERELCSPGGTLI